MAGGLAAGLAAGRAAGHVWMRHNAFTKLLLERETSDSVIRFYAAYSYCAPGHLGPNHPSNAFKKISTFNLNRN